MAIEAMLKSGRELHAYTVKTLNHEESDIDAEAKD